MIAPRDSWDACAAHTALLRQIDRALCAAGAPFELSASSQQRWASATFIGARHCFRFASSGKDIGDGWLGTIAEMEEKEFPLGGHILADISSRYDRANPASPVLVVEALTVQAA